VIFREGNTMLLVSVAASTISSPAVRDLATAAARRHRVGLRAQKYRSTSTGAPTPAFRAS
jgi:hypothetical protein